MWDTATAGIVTTASNMYNAREYFWKKFNWFLALKFVFYGSAFTLIEAEIIPP